jgi:hypothetical protein
MNLMEQLLRMVDSYWADEVQILGAWRDQQGATCLVYRRIIEPGLTFGRRVEFTETSADGTIEGFAQDVALNLAEPIGALAFSGRQDQYGVIWVAIPEDISIPTPPVGTTRMLDVRASSDPAADGAVDPDDSREGITGSQ